MKAAPLLHRLGYRRRRGLRFRITTSFALGALGVALTLSLITYGLTRRSVLNARQTAAVHQTLANASAVRNALRSSSLDVPELLSSLETPSGSNSLLFHHGWFATSFAVGQEAIPGPTRRAVAGGRPVTQNYSYRGHPELVVGVPLPSVQAQYYELFDLSDVRRTLDALAISLAAASVATTLVGLAVGRWASRRVLAPLTETARAAAAIAGGQLDTRLEAGQDVDLTELATSFNSMVTALQQRIQRDARFASDVSHELRSPLTTLSAAVEVLERRRDELPERSVRALDLLSEEVRRFGQLVEDLLEVSRFDAGSNDLSLEEVSPAELVRQAIGVLRADQVAVEVAPGAEDIRIRADKRRLERVLANLLDNADAHGGGAVRVAVEPGPAGGVVIAVDDAGPGVPVEAREAVFERFARGPAAGDRSRWQGVGLGLSLVAEHVRLHRGSVGVEDSPEGGARFSVELPADPDEAAVPLGPRAGRRRARARAG
ncbi:MAG TPA: HAMP domain-containing sensor histidine kinase [Acidimicrobiales bacterium]|nr:HAMP domain-containing sensor histidine kinase [Acidimicrobiales bacterium]